MNSSWLFNKITEYHIHPPAVLNKNDSISIATDNLIVWHWLNMCMLLTIPMILGNLQSPNTNCVNCFTNVFVFTVDAEILKDWRKTHTIYPGLLRGATYVLSLTFKACHFTNWGGSHVTVAILLLYYRFSLSLSQFQPIFVSFVTISAVPCHSFQGHVACRNLP